MAAINFLERTVTVNWSASSSATTSYIIEAGTASGASDLATIPVNAPATGGLWSNVEPRSQIFVRVKAQSANGISAPSQELRLEMPDLRDVIEGLFFSSGLYGEGRPRHANAMLGWPAGSTVTVRVPHSVEGAQFEAIDRTVAAFNNALGGLNLVIARETLTRSDYDRQLPSGITILVNQGQCLQGDGAAAACAQWSPSPVFQRVLILMPTGNENPATWAHELGHAVGLMHCHLKVKIPSTSNIFLLAPYAPIMGATAGEVSDGMLLAPPSPSQFGAFELEAVRRVYQAGLRPGSPFGDFVARGLIKP